MIIAFFIYQIVKGGRRSETEVAVYCVRGRVSRHISSRVNPWIGSMDATYRCLVCLLVQSNDEAQARDHLKVKGTHEPKLLNERSCILRCKKVMKGVDSN